MNTLEDDVRAEIRHCLRAADLSQAAAARSLGITPKHLSQMMTGRAKLSFRWAEAIAFLCDRELVVCSRCSPRR